MDVETIGLQIDDSGAQQTLTRIEQILSKIDQTAVKAAEDATKAIGGLAAEATKTNKSLESTNATLAKLDDVATKSAKETAAALGSIVKESKRANQSIEQTGVALERRLVQVQQTAAESGKAAAKGLAQIGNTADNIWGKIEALNSSFSKFRGFAAGGLSVIGFIKGVEKISEAADVLSDLSEQVDISVEAFQLLGRVGDDTNIKQTQLVNALEKVRSSLASLATGDEAAEKQFKKLGLSAEDFANMSFEDAFFKVADSISGMEDNAKKVAAATSIFGDKMGGKLLPMLEAVRGGIKDVREEYEGMLGVASKADAEAAASFAKSIEATKNAFSSFSIKWLGKWQRDLTESIAYFSGSEPKVTKEAPTSPIVSKAMLDEAQLEKTKVVLEEIDKLRSESNFKSLDITGQLLELHQRLVESERLLQDEKEGTLKYAQRELEVEKARAAYAESFRSAQEKFQAAQSASADAAAKRMLDDMAPEARLKKLNQMLADLDSRIAQSGATMKDNAVAMPAEFGVPVFAVGEDYLKMMTLKSDIKAMIDNAQKDIDAKETQRIDGLKSFSEALGLASAKAETYNSELNKVTDAYQAGIISEEEFNKGLEKVHAKFGYGFDPDQLQEFADGLDNATNKAKKLAAEIAKINAAEKAGMISKTDAEKARVDATAKSGGRIYQNRTTPELQRMLADTKTAEEEKLRIREEFNKRTQESNMGTVEAFKAGMTDMVLSFGNATEQMMNAGRDTARSISSHFEDAMTDSILNFNNAGESFAKMADAIFADLTRIAVRIAITQPLMQGMTSMIGGGVGAVGHTGGDVGALHQRRFHTGGTVPGEVIIGQPGERLRMVSGLDQSRERTGGASQPSVNVVNVLDASEVVRRGLASNRDTIINLVASERNRLRALLA